LGIDFLQAFRIILLSFVAMTLGAALGAQVEQPPTIIVADTEREVRAAAAADSEFSQSNELWTMEGPFVHVVSTQSSGDMGSTSFAQAGQDSQISTFSISGSGSAEGSASLGGGEFPLARGNSVSSIAVSFSVPVDAPYTLSGSFTATGEDQGTCLSFTNVAFAGLDPDGFPFFHSQSFSCVSEPEDATFFFTGMVGANAPLGLGVEASVDSGSFNKFPALGPGEASFELIFSFGDRDADGLFDAWEKEGIDIDGDGTPEIDLPGLGANPDKKDLFVEVDIMSGVVIDPAGFSLVREAFAEAPAWMVDNPDGSKGINLHVIWDDGDAPPNQPLVDPLNGSPSQMQSVKTDFYGSSSDRSLGNWNQIREARLKVFRYCVIGDSVSKDGTSVAGLGEIPGNDFVVGVNALSRSEQATKGLAGFLMHELGHNLGLKHGGQDGINFKPNYLSVMNYAYAVPYLVADAQGNNFADYWRLDYSRSAPGALNENTLVESEGLDGPSGRAILFNSSSSSMPVKSFGWANSPVIDWNNNGTTDPTPYEQDLTHTTAFQDSSLDVLRSFTDWDRLWYHLSGHPTFDEGLPPDASSVEVGISLSEMDDLISGEWVDQTALGDLIFENGFELGSTTAWSDTVP
jgi:hypothetical protein